MGGKNKQRTKNNAKPSSSGRSAELLSSSVGGLAVGTVGTGITGLSLFPSLAAAPLHTDLPSEFALPFKKLTKKDPITRIKALTELRAAAERAGEGSAEALGAWAPAYRALAVDPDRQVREAAQRCHGAVMGACGRRAAGALRAVAPPWLLAAHDTHQPAAHAAAAALHKIFPGSKLRDMLLFCRNEVTEYFIDILTGGFDDVISKRIEEAEERADTSVRVRRGAVGALAAALRTVGRHHDHWRPALRPLTADDTFWRLAKHQDARLRGEWYECLAEIACAMGDEPCGSQTVCGRAAGVLLTARETANPPAAARCAALLTLARHRSDLYDLLDDRIRPKLRDLYLEFLQNGGWGGGQSPADILPALPAVLRTQQFYHDFFDAALQGLKQKCIAESKSNSVAWLGDTLQCVEELLKQDCTAEVGRAHRLCAEAALQAECKAALAAVLARRTARLVRAALHRNQDGLARALLQNLPASALSHLDQVEAECGEGTRPPAAFDDAVTAHVALVRELRAALGGVKPPRRAVKFADEATPGEKAPEEETPEKAATEDAVEWTAGNAAAVRLGEEAAARVVARLLEAGRGAYAAAALGAAAGAMHDWGAAAVRAVSEAAGRPPGALLQELLPGTPAPRPAARLARAFLPHLAPHDQDALYHIIEREPALLMASLQEADDAVVWRLLRSGGTEGALRGATRAALLGDQDMLHLVTRCLTLAAQHTDGSGVVCSVVECAAGVGAGAGAVCEGAGAMGGAAILGAAHTAPPPLQAQLLTAVLTALLHLPQGESEEECNMEGAALRGAGAALRHAPPPARAHMLLAAAARVHQHLTRCKGLEIGEAKRCGVMCAALAGGEADILTALVEPPPGECGCPPPAALALLHDLVRGRYCSPAPSAGGAVWGALRLHPADPDARPGPTPHLRPALARAFALHAALRPPDHTPPPPHLEDALVDAIAATLHDRAAIAAAADAFPYAQCGMDLKSAAEALGEVVAEIEAAVGQWEEGEARLAAAVGRRAHQEGAYWAAAAARLPPLGAPYHTAPTHDATHTADGFFHTIQAGVGWEWDMDKLSAEEYRVVFGAAARCWVAARGGPQGALLLGAAADPVLPPDHLDPLLDGYYLHRDTLPDPNKDVAELDWTEASCMSSLAVVLGAGAARGALGGRQWDAACLLGAALLGAVAGAVPPLAPPAAALAVAALRLYRELARAAPSAGSERAAEWQDVFLPEMKSHATGLLLKLLSPLHEDGECASATMALVCEGMRRVVCAGLVSGGEAGAVGAVAGAAGAALARHCPPHTLALAYATLHMLQQPLAKEDEVKLAAWGAAASEGGSEAPPPLALHYLLPPLHTALDRLHAILEHVKVGEEVWGGSSQREEELAACGGMLLGAAALEMGAARRDDLAHQYSPALGALLPALLPAALRLLPPPALAPAPAPAPALADLFTRPPPTDIYTSWRPISAVWGAAACRCVLAAGGGAAARSLREWLATAPPRPAALLRRLVLHYCSHAHARDQLEEVGRLAKSLGEAEVSVWVSVGGREARVSVEGEGGRAALTLRLPPDFPAQPPRVSGTRAHTVALFVGGRGGSVAGAVRLWAGAVAARASAAPTCYICYCRLHPASGLTPAVPCYQCGNSFHRQCLQQWFASSNRANCPLCRTTF